MFFGNIFVYYQFQDKDHIDSHTRVIVISVLTIIAILGILFLAFLRPAVSSHEDNELSYQQTVMENATDALKNAWKLFITREMMLLCLTFMYTGIKTYFFILLKYFTTQLNYNIQCSPLH